MLAWGCMFGLRGALIFSCCTMQLLTCWEVGPIHIHLTKNDNTLSPTPNLATVGHHKTLTTVIDSHRQPPGLHYSIVSGGEKQGNSCYQLSDQEWPHLRASWVHRSSGSMREEDWGVSRTITLIYSQSTTKLSKVGDHNRKDGAQRYHTRLVMLQCTIPCNRWPKPTTVRPFDQAEGSTKWALSFEQNLNPFKG